MMLLSMLTWWYTTGWGELVSRVGKRIEMVMETFSVSLLIGSLFEPFRQISAANTGARGFDAQMRAFGDRLFSRVFGAAVRSLFIFLGMVSTSLVAVAGALQIALWPVVPAFPLIGAVLALTGWVF